MAVRCGDELRVVDISAGLAGALVLRQLIDAGAQAVRIVPVEGDPFDRSMPCYAVLKEGAEEAPATRLDDLLEKADICLVGGDHAGLDRPSLPEGVEHRWPQLVVLDLAAYAGSERVSPPVDLLVQARTGLVSEQLPDRPVAFSMALPSYGQALTGLLGVWAAIVERDGSGRGQVVRATMQQGVSLFWSQLWMDASRPDALFDKLPPKGVKHLIFQCREGDWIHFVLGVPGAVAKLYAVLGINTEVDPTDRGVPTLARGPESYFADRVLLEPVIRLRGRDELVAALRAVGLAAEPVMAPGEVWSERQVIETGLIRRMRSGDRSPSSPLRFVAHPGSRAGSRAPDAASGSGPLAGVRVIDLGNFIAGPFASKLLADLGADVIRVEPPGSLAALTGIRNTWASNRGKRSIVADMKTEEGLALVHDLCATADVVTHNFRVGVAARLRIDPATLRRRRGDVVTLETSGYGSAGPRAAEPGWDMVMQALCGHEVRAGGLGGAPMWYRSALIDFATGAVGAIGCLMGLHARNRGIGSIEVQNSLLATALFLMSELVERPDGVFVGAPVLDAGTTGFNPAERLYRCLDGWIAVSARSELGAARLAGMVGLGPAAPPALWGAAEAEHIAAWVAERSTSDALAELCAAGVLARYARRTAGRHCAAIPPPSPTVWSSKSTTPPTGRFEGCSDRWSRSRARGRTGDSVPPRRLARTRPK